MALYLSLTSLRGLVGGILTGEPALTFVSLLGIFASGCTVLGAIAVIRSPRAAAVVFGLGGLVSLARGVLLSFAEFYVLASSSFVLMILAAGATRRPATKRAGVSATRYDSDWHPLSEGGLSGLSVDSTDTKHQPSV